MAVTLLQIRGYVRDWLAVNSTRLPDASLTQAINFAQKDILRSHDLWFAETPATSSLTAGTQAYALPTATVAFSRPISIDYTDPANTSNLIELDEVPWDEFRKTYGITIPPSGDPIVYALFGSQIYYGPTPDRNMTVTLSYYGVFADLAADGDNNALTNSAYELVLFTAAAYACRYIIEDSRAPMFDALAAKELRIINAEHVRRLNSAKRAPAMREPS